MKIKNTMKYDIFKHKVKNVNVNSDSDLDPLNLAMLY